MQVICCIKTASNVFKTALHNSIFIHALTQITKTTSATKDLMVGIIQRCISKAVLELIKYGENLLRQPLCINIDVGT
jgi:hypothetical protein